MSINNIVKRSISVKFYIFKYLNKIYKDYVQEEEENFLKKNFEDRKICSSLTLNFKKNF